ncbi:hypothetical protein BBP40_003171 [Aspergillus hancockii]|nr:hypothetical protein BBP40_003171 [Aspergillus hancockii]
MSDMEKQIEAVLRDIADLEAVLLAQNDNERARACRKVLEQLSHMVNATKGNGKRHVVSNLKVAARALVCLVQGLQISTPSPLSPELTISINNRCPRHNSEGITHADYGNMDYHQDPYFDQFEGYNEFRGMVFSVFPEIYIDALGRQAFIAEKDLHGVIDDLNSATDRLGESFQDTVRECIYEANIDADLAGIPLPSHALELLRERKEGEQKDKWHEVLIYPDEIKDFSECPMMRDVADILHGRWSGKPHWTAA